MTLHEEAGKGVIREALRNNDWYRKRIGELDEKQVSNFVTAILLQRSTIFTVGKNSRHFLFKGKLDKTR